jgi:hypothetical protein
MMVDLDYPNEAEIRWLFEQGVPDTAMLEPTPIRAANAAFLDGNTFDFDSGGGRTFIFKVLDSDDLIAWDPKRNALATWRGAAFALGQDAIWNPASYFMDSALRVHRTPLDWLKADRDGICIVQPKWTYALLRHARTLAFADPVFAQQVKRWLRPPKSEVKIIVEIQKEKVGA